MTIPVARSLSVSQSGKKRRRVRALLIDLDDTLYRNEEVPAKVRAAISKFMVEKLGYSSDNVTMSMQSLYSRYGTTLAGLAASGHKVDFDDWHKSVHYGQLEYNELLKPDVSLRELLCSIDVPKYILTNADKKHAEICLDRLGIRDCFKEVFDFEWAMERGATRNLLTQEHPVLCKPSHSIYQLALEEMGCEPSEVIFFDDSARNIQAAHELGMHTCVVGTETLVPGADMALLSMHALPQALPELIDQPGVVHDSKHAATAAAEVPAAAARAAVAPAAPATGSEDHRKLDEEATTAPLITVAQGRGGRASCDGL